MRHKKGIKRSQVRASQQKAKAITKKRAIKKATKKAKPSKEKQRIKREQKRATTRVMEQAQKALYAKKRREQINKINEIKERRRAEILGLIAIFRIVNGRNIGKTDKFEPNDIKNLCEKFINLHKDTEEHKILITLAEKKIKQVEVYNENQKKLNLPVTPKNSII